jgi:hypothetical protein
MAPLIGFIFEPRQWMATSFWPKGPYSPEASVGAMSLGLDIGITASGALV